MKITLSVLCLISSAIAFEIGKIDPLSDEFIDSINKQQSSWVAGRNFPKGTTLEDIRHLLGALTPDLSLDEYEPTVHSNDTDIPESFDARTNFTKCTNVISTIADQSACSSSWAVAAASVMSDRRCIQSNGNLTVPVSALDLLACCYNCGLGCNGGLATSAFSYWHDSGIATGGLYGSEAGCKPYSLKNCDHYVKGKYEPCGARMNAPICEKKCSVKDLDYKSEITYGATVQYFRKAENIQREILKNGPVASTFTIFTDFLSYKSGVYKQVSGVIESSQAVRILGWGVDEASKLPYWLVANSWNEEWGDKGLFKILRGTNECNIENAGVAGLAKI